jgi:hypothetical protein
MPSGAATLKSQTPGQGKVKQKSHMPHMQGPPSPCLPGIFFVLCIWNLSVIASLVLPNALVYLKSLPNMTLWWPPILWPPSVPLPLVLLEFSLPLTPDLSGDTPPHGYLHRS